MDQVLNVHTVNDYARYQGAEVLHRHVSVIHYDELEHFRHSLNRYDVYGIFLADEVTEGQKDAVEDRKSTRLNSSH